MVYKNFCIYISFYIFVLQCNDASYQIVNTRKKYVYHRILKNIDVTILAYLLPLIYIYTNVT